MFYSLEVTLQNPELEAVSKRLNPVKNLLCISGRSDRELVSALLSFLEQVKPQNSEICCFHAANTRLRCWDTNTWAAFMSRAPAGTNTCHLHLCAACLQGEKTAEKDILADIKTQSGKSLRLSLILLLFLESKLQLTASYLRVCFHVGRQF